MGAHAQPLIWRILHRKLRQPAEAEDLASRVVVLLLSRLHQLKSGSSAGAIQDFDSYVATTTYRAYHDHLREKYPARHRAKTSLRYLLRREPRFALWQRSEGAWLCGWAAWQDEERFESTPDLLSLASSDARLHLPSWERRHLTSALAAIFDCVGHPIHFDSLVRFLADQAAHILSGNDPVSELGARRHLENPARQADDRIFLKQLWTGILNLPLAMRTVLLLNLRGRDGRDAIGLLPATGVASLCEMAKALEMPVAELATLWSDLPLDDRTLAVRLGVSRQQVANLRASARRRLARHAGYVA